VQEDESQIKMLKNAMSEAEKKLKQMKAEHAQRHSLEVNRLSELEPQKKAVVDRLIREKDALKRWHMVCQGGRGAACCK
jgi:hypothetical protein